MFKLMYVPYPGFPICLEHENLILEKQPRIGGQKQSWEQISNASGLG
jgi:hypothetical protein